MSWDLKVSFLVIAKRVLGDSIELVSCVVIPLALMSSGTSFPSMADEDPPQIKSFAPVTPKRFSSAELVSLKVCLRNRSVWYKTWKAKKQKKGSRGHPLDEFMMD